MQTSIQLNAGTFAPILDSTLSDVDQVDRIKDYMGWVEDKLLSEVQATIGLDHSLADGLYVRTMRAPAGTIICGAAHKKACMTMLVSGTISILTPVGAALLTGPLVFPSVAGVKRLGHCHTDVIWSTIHAVTSTDLDSIEDELYSFED